MAQQYSVLMSVYYKERPEFLRISMESMFTQTVPPDDFVLVCDGPLNDALDQVICSMKSQYPEVLQIIRLKENSGLGNALQEGLQYCKNELVARMDSDDISLPNRCELQLAAFAFDPALTIVGGAIDEFVDSPDKITGRRRLPERHEDICVFSKKRCPFNHVTVMFSKKAIMSVGGYDEKYHLFEDYYLWARMLMSGCITINFPDTFVYVRMENDVYRRRGGWQYAKEMLKFHHWMRRSGWTDLVDFITGAIPHAVICVSPNFIRRMAYKRLRGSLCASKMQRGIND